MSYVHCEEHNEDATNGCPVCERNIREARFAHQPRPWRRERYSPAVYDAMGKVVCIAATETLAELIIGLINEELEP